MKNKKTNPHTTMKLMKTMPAALLLLSMSLCVYAQDDEETVDAIEGETEEVFVPTAPTEKAFFHRVQLGFIGTSAKYTNDNSEHQARVPESEKYFLKGVSLGWLGDLRLSKKLPLYFEIGANLAFLTGNDSRSEVNRYSHGDGVKMDYETRVQAFTLTIPINIAYQFKDVAKVEGLTLAPFAGPYIRFNVVADRKQTVTETVYDRNDAAGNDVIKEVNVTSETRSLMKDNLNGDDGWMEGGKHRGKLAQVGVQLGVNAFYKRYSFGLAYMHDLTPFAKHSSPLGLTSKETAQGGQIPMSGTGCDMKISTRHNFMVSVGYVF